MKLNKILIPTLAVSSLASCFIPLTSCNNSDSQKSFGFGNCATYTPKKAALAKQTGKNKKELVQMWMHAIKEDPTIFYDDVHHAVDEEFYVHKDKYDQFSVLPKGNLNFKYFKVSDDETKISFEIEYYFFVQLNKDEPSFGPTWNEYELSGRMDVYNFPIVPANADDIVIDEYVSDSGNKVPYVAASFNKNKNANWYIHGIEIGTVADRAGNKFESAHNGWISGYNVEQYVKYSLGYFIETLPFIYEFPESYGGGWCLNISNYYLKDNVPSA